MTRYAQQSIAEEKCNARQLAEAAEAISTAEQGQQELEAQYKASQGVARMLLATEAQLLNQLAAEVRYVVHTQLIAANSAVSNSKPSPDARQRH